MRLHRCTIYPALPLLATLHSFVSSQSILDTIPTCYVDCIRQSGDVTCNGIDIPCLCRLSNGNFLPNVITCMKSNCDNNLDTTALVGPVASVCEGEGVPVAPFAIANAISIGSALLVGPTSTLTGATTVTSSFASAGTAYVVAVPMSASSGRSGLRTVTGTPTTIKAASITGNSRMSSQTRSSSSSTSSQSSSSRSSSSSSSSSVTTTTNSFTTTTVVTTRSSATAAPSAGTEVVEVAQYSGNGTPFSAASLARPGVDRWTTIGIVCGLLLVLAWL